MELLGLGLATIALFVGFGLLVGVCFGFFGMGGSFLVTPVLLVLDFPATVAVGSGLAFVFGTSVVGALRHRAHGQVDYRLAGLMVVGMLLGIEVGKRAVFLLDALGSAEVVISVAYVGLLGAVGLFVHRDARSGNPTGEPRAGDTGAEDTRSGDARTDDTRSGDTSTRDSRSGDARAGDTHTGPVGVATAVRTVSPPPHVSRSGGGSVSVWIVLAAGVGIGVLSGFLGVGGGFLLLPVMTYGFGVPAAIAAGTSTLQIVVAGGFGTFVYAQSGAVDVPVVAALLAGSALGARVGVGATRLVSEADLEEYFATTLLAGSVAVASKQVGSAVGVEPLETASALLVFGTVLLVSAAIVHAAIGGLTEERGRGSSSTR